MADAGMGGLGHQRIAHRAALAAALYERIFLSVFNHLCCLVVECARIGEAPIMSCRAAASQEADLLWKPCDRLLAIVGSKARE
jgi:hypothetical protein